VKKSPVGAGRVRQHQPPAGSIITFHRHNADFKAGDVGVICSFGAGYSIGSVVVRRT
jgi:3-oxoacyl-[acyl-carrier-protein] synthase III